MTAPNPMSYVADWDGEHHAYPAGSVVRHAPSGKMYVCTSPTHKAHAYRSDTFDNRLIENGWGASSSGARWTVRNIDPDNPSMAGFSVQDGQGTISYDVNGLTNGTAGNGWFTWGGALGQTDLDWVLQWSFDEAAVGATGGASVGFTIVLRSDIAWDFAAPEMDLSQHDGSTTFDDRLWVYGHSGSGSNDLETGVILAAGTTYKTRMRSYQGTYSVRTWAADQPEPVTWQNVYVSAAGDDITDTYALFNFWEYLAPHQILRFDSMAIQSVVPAPPDDPAHWLSLQGGLEIVPVDDSLTLTRAHVMVVSTISGPGKTLTLPPAAACAGQQVVLAAVSGATRPTVAVQGEEDSSNLSSEDTSYYSDGIRWFGLDF